ncbi:Chromatin modification-related protein png2 [Mizuhopecten yessoensis]|uniref:Chromatin modification-related protein png2 n=1 Tax=Mizuhopecten yessoensis TaxID=6573 RepID=A0A210QIF3_MIZYE|nr:Chromatin modification-related protein png2 [Mizuhopecten yessoensis]
MVVAKLVRKEIEKVLKSDLHLFKDVSLETISSFSWSETLATFAAIAPLTYSVLTGIATTSKGASTLTRGKTTNLKPMLGCALATLLHAKAPRKASFMPTLFSIQLWRGGLKKDTLKQVSRTGLCLGYKGTVNAIDKIRHSFDEVARTTKEQLHEQLSAGVPDQPHVDEDELELSIALSHTLPDEEVQLDNEEDSENAEEESDDEDIEDEEEEEVVNEEDDVDLEDIFQESLDDVPEISMQLDLSGIVPVHDDSDTEPDIYKDAKELHPGFTTCWDNVGKRVITRNPSVEKGNTYINMALGYMAINRVPVTHLEAFNGTTPAVELPLDIFVLNEENFCERDFRISTILGRILNRHLPWFRDHFGDCAIPHIMHMHSNEMRKKSVLVNLGVFDENPSSTNGAIGIYRKIQQYIPSVDEKPYPTIVFGDGLSCERGNGAHNACSGELDPWRRLEGLQPSPQEFHKEMLLLQDHFAEFCRDSAADFGTLCFLKNTFNFRQVKQEDIGNCFSDAWELMCLATEGYVCLAVMEKFGLESLDDKPKHAPDGIEDDEKEEREKYLKNVVGELLQYFKGDAASQDSSYQYCNCRTDLGEEPMVGCAAKSKCARQEWYHLQCLGLPLDELPKGAWFCSDACAKRKKGKRGKLPKETVTFDQEDRIEGYCKAMVWRGLNLLCRRDAVREGDGETMIRYWRFDLPYFMEKKHPKYVILAHRLLCATHGWLPEKVREELIWNRTVNYSGGVGRNLPMDLMNELLNRLFKDQLESAKGRYTDETIQRCDQIIGPLGESLDEIFDERVIENELYRHRRRAKNRDSNVQKLVNSLLSEDLFKTISGRKFKAYAGFEFSENLHLAGQYQHKLDKLSANLDQRRNVTLNQ